MAQFKYMRGRCLLVSGKVTSSVRRNRLIVFFLMKRESKISLVTLQQLNIRSASLSDGGKYTCKASNEAGSSDIDLILKVSLFLGSQQKCALQPPFYCKLQVLVPPKIDKSNIIGNPLAIVDRNIYLECPVSGNTHPADDFSVVCVNNRGIHISCF